MPIGLNPMQQNPERAKGIHQYLDEQEKSFGKMLSTAFVNAQKKTQELQKKKKTVNKKLGQVAVSNTDSVSRCQKLKAQLNAKLGEIYASTMDEKMKSLMARDVMMQITKVEVKIGEIKRRERAIQEEKLRKKNESEHVKRKRRSDMEKRTTTIRKDYLYSAEDGGFDPNDPLGLNAMSADMPVVTAEIGGNEISVSEADASAAAAEMSAESFEAAV